MPGNFMRTTPVEFESIQDSDRLISLCRQRLFLGMEAFFRNDTNLNLWQGASDDERTIAVDFFLRNTVFLEDVVRPNAANYINELRELRGA